MSFHCKQFSKLLNCVVAHRLASCENDHEMRVISQKPLREFWEHHADAEPPLRQWLTAVKAAKWKNFSELRATFGSADVYKDLTIFNIGGNKYRLIVAINYKTQ